MFYISARLLFHRNNVSAGLLSVSRHQHDELATLLHPIATPDLILAVKAGQMLFRALRQVCMAVPLYLRSALVDVRMSNIRCLLIIRQTHSCRPHRVSTVADGRQ